MLAAIAKRVLDLAGMPGDARVLFRELSHWGTSEWLFVAGASVCLATWVPRRAWHWVGVASLAPDSSESQSMASPAEYLSQRAQRLLDIAKTDPDTAVDILTNSWPQMFRELYGPDVAREYSEHVEHLETTGSGPATIIESAGSYVTLVLRRDVISATKKNARLKRRVAKNKAAIEKNRALIRWLKFTLFLKRMRNAWFYVHIWALKRRVRLLTKALSPTSGPPQP